MSLSTTANKVIHDGNDSATSFSYTFPIQSTDDLVVIYTDADGVETELTPSQYSVTGIGTTTGGAVTYPLTGSPIATGTLLTILRTVAETQPTVLSNQGGYYPNVVEAALDRIVMIEQQLDEMISRALVTPITDDSPSAIPQDAAARANTALLFDADGNPYAGAIASDLSGVSPFILANLLPAASASAARTAIGALGTADIDPLVNPHLRSYLAGLTLSRSSATVLAVAAGFCIDSTNTIGITLGAFTKSTAGTWVTGTGNNGMGTGLTIANSTTYHVFAIINGGAADFYFDTSASAANKPASTTAFRRIGSFRTNGSAQIIDFVQDGDEFRWLTAVADISSTNPGTSAVTRTLTVPTGVRVRAIVSARLSAGSDAENAVGLLSDLSVSDQAPGSGFFNVGVFAALNTSGGSSLGGAGELYIFTNTSAQIRSRINTSGASTNLAISTLGWIDRRGRDA